MSELVLTGTKELRAEDERVDLVEDDGRCIWLVQHTYVGDPTSS
ncbi:hypothetical protein PF010_g30044 [Phytophthora fragariae]|uniref:Uncharacterized protein n=2 Tax=Phytophthora TaxID=4783 RepID=A0A6A3GGC8_9STRA|nr:hypothetical protein PF011_g31127 [Phytophthora fragariae]KAE8958398.1 hypothetical protein PR002_g30881 [Phytophthora rubi]KAE8976880.1 hypothetical protein PR001_g25286 [Phytophthora rubi]KAE9060868.1 hypothetical protein PF010_g30044 [Phytophthora fragariae]KAE9160249.1 hypothetical protein PF004_g31249 [Phytophthora fragariae]